MNQHRLSRLQKTILVALREKDIADTDFYRQKFNKQPPFWNSIRTTYVPGMKFMGRKIDTGISELVSKAIKKSGSSFHASFSRSIRNLQTKGFIEIKYMADNAVEGSSAYRKYQTIKAQAEYLKLTIKGFNVNNSFKQLNNKEHQSL